MNFKVIKQLYKKEILDVLRDKKTIIMMVIVPLLIYPLMFVGGMVMMSKVTTQMDTQTYEIAVDFMDTNPELVEMFLHPDDDTLHFKLCDLNVMDADISMILRGEKINAIVYENEDGTGYNIAYLSSVTNSSYAEQKVAFPASGVGLVSSTFNSSSMQFTTFTLPSCTSSAEFTMLKLVCISMALR